MSLARAAIEPRQGVKAVVFVNDTGGPVTITRVYNDNNTIVPTAYVSKEINKGKVVSYPGSWNISLQSNSSSKMFNPVNETIKVDYTTADNQNMTHQFPAREFKIYNASFPRELNIVLAVGEYGKPRMYKLTKQTYQLNGMPYYLDTQGNIAVYFEFAGGYAYWAVLYGSTTIAYGEMIPANRNCSLEEAYMLFPMDCSYGATWHWIKYNGTMGRASVNTSSVAAKQAALGHSQYSMLSVTGQADVRFIYFRIMDSVGGWNDRNVRPIGDSVTVDDVLYRSDRQYYSDIYSVPTNKMSTQRASHIIELSALDYEANPFTGSDDMLFEWEILQQDYQAVRFVTQYSTFTVDLTRLGITRSGEAACRCRVLRMGRVTTHTNEPGITNNEGLGAWSGWKLLPTIYQTISNVALYDANHKGWFKVKVTSGDSGPIYQDCGWDTKLVYAARASGGLTKIYPMVYMEDYIAAGVGGNMSGEFDAAGTVNMSVGFHHNNSSISSVDRGHPGSGAPYDTNDPGVWIRDNVAHWGGTNTSAGTYAAGYQCCGVEASQNYYTGRHHNGCVIKLNLDESSANTTDKPTFVGSDTTSWNQSY